MKFKLDGDAEYNTEKQHINVMKKKFAAPKPKYFLEAGESGKEKNPHEFKDLSDQNLKNSESENRRYEAFAEPRKSAVLGQQFVVTQKAELVSSSV